MHPYFNHEQPVPLPHPSFTPNLTIVTHFPSLPNY